MGVQVKILGIAGSPRHGNTNILVKEALVGACEIGYVETEFISLADLNIKGGCKAEYLCYKPVSRELMCRGYQDDMNMLLRKMIDSDGMVIGSPVYWGGVSWILKAVFDRSMSIEVGLPLRSKVGGALVVASSVHGGHEGTIEDIHKWFLIHDMIIVAVGPDPCREEGGCYGAMATTIDEEGKHVSGIYSAVMQAVKNDKIGLAAAKALGKRVAEVAKILKVGYENLPVEELGWPKRLQV